MRIYVLGQSGSGKSTFAHRLSNVLHIPHIELDAIWFSVDADRNKFSKEVLPKLEQSDWIIDGKHKTVRKEIMEAADEIIYFELPLTLHIRNNISRTLANKEPRRAFLKHLIKVVREFNSVKNQIALELQEYTSKTKIFKTYQDSEEYIKTKSRL